MGGVLGARILGARRMAPSDVASFDRAGRSRRSIVETRSLAVLRKALATTRANGTWVAYWNALMEVAATGTEESERLLVEIMGDPTLHLPGAPETGRAFYRWLKESRVPGILAAARTRAAIDLRERPEARSRGSGWLSLVAARGGPADVAWIESHGTGRDWALEVDRALAEGSSSLAAAQRLTDRLKNPDHFLWGKHLDAFARENPEAAYDAAMEALPGPRTSQREELLKLVGSTTTQESLADVRALLDSLETDKQRLDAVAVVERIHRRGLPVNEFDAIIDIPRRIVREFDSGDLPPQTKAEEARLRSALNVVRSNPVTWDAPTLAAIKRVAERVDGELAKFAERASATLEKGLAEKSAAWSPER